MDHPPVVVDCRPWFRRMLGASLAAVAVGAGLAAGAVWLEAEGRFLAEELAFFPLRQVGAIGGLIFATIGLAGAAYALTFVPRSVTLAEEITLHTWLADRSIAWSEVAAVGTIRTASRVSPLGQLGGLPAEVSSRQPALRLGGGEIQVIPTALLDWDRVRPLAESRGLWSDADLAR